jgi:hypothetical protein
MKKVSLEEKIKQVWQTVFHVEPKVERNPYEPDAIVIEDGFELFPEEKTVETETILGKQQKRVQGWGTTVLIYTYSYQDGPDGDVVDLGWDPTFNQALQRIIRAKFEDMMNIAMEGINLYEAWWEDQEENANVSVQNR